MANGIAKSGSPNGSAMRPKYLATNRFPFLRCGTTATFGGLVNVAQSNRRFIMVLCSPNEHLSPSWFLGPVGDLGTLPKEVWRVANWKSAHRMKHSFNCFSLLS
uniref:Uncharacterized protein n=1 Tax=Solanum tuberosum TaxID=4113 RepID=M1D893_SOLTU